MRQSPKENIFKNRATKISKDENHEVKLPSLLSLLWLILMQPLTLHHRLKARGIENPNASIFELWFTKDETRLVKRQYVKQFLLLLLVVMPMISWAITYLFFGSILKFPVDFLQWVAFLLGGVVGGLVGGILPGGMIVGVAVSVAVGVTVSVAGGMAFAVAFGLVVSVAVSVAGGMTVGVAVGVAVSIAVGVVINVAGGVVGGVAVGVAVGVVGSVARVISGGITGGVVRNLAGGLVGALIGSLIFTGISIFYYTILYSKYLPSFNYIIIISIFTSLIFLLGYLRLPFYLIESIWQIICYTIQKITNFSTLRFVPVLYHNLSFFPHPFLAQHIILGAKTEPELAKKVIDACAFSPGQYHIGQVALAYLHQNETHDNAL